jgi:putative ABC transport system permease protein
MNKVLIMLDTVIGDVRFAFRTLQKAPTFALAVTATIALAVGSTTAIFAVVDNILLRPLPFPESERAVALCETNPITQGWCGASPMNVADWSRMTRALDSAGVARSESFIGRDAAGKYGGNGAIVTPGFFRVLRVRPMLGRLIEDGDLAPGSNHVAVVSYEFWQRRLGADPSIVGRALAIDSTPFTIVGVLPAGAWMPDQFADVQAWKPLTASIDNVANRNWRGFTAIGRMAPGVSESGLVAELNVVRSQLATAYPVANKDWGLRVIALREKAVGDSSTTLWVFLGTTVFVLLIACANVAGLLLVRATGRGAEFALRASLGAGRSRLIQQLMTESVVLSLIGGAFGLLLAVWATASFVELAPANLPRLAEVGIDGRVVAFALLLAAATAMVFGLAPARRAWTTDVNDALKGARSGGATDSRLRAGFAVVQLALALVLLFGAGLLTRSFARYTNWDPGFDRSNVMMTFMLPPRTADSVALMLQVRDEVAGVPGVQSATLASGGPSGSFGGGDSDGIAVEGQAAIAPDQMPKVDWFDIEAHYFETLGVRIVRGRGPSAADTAGAPHIAIVNETLARRFFPTEDPIGRRVTVQKHPGTIVGVVADVRPMRPDEPVAPQIYWPIQQYRRGAAYLIMRIAPGMAGLEKTILARVAGVNAGIDLGRFDTLDARFARRLVSPRFNMLLVAWFATVAVLMAAVGVYGVIAYGVASRTREFGVRVALGATPAQLVRSVVGRGMSLAAIGIVAGSVGALAVGRLLTSLLYGLPARDPVTLVGAVAVLSLVAAIACWVPARRASRVDPAAALRAQ